MLYALLALCLVGSAGAAPYRFEVCPIFEVQPDLNISKFLGTWYLSHESSIVYITCVKFDYSAGENGTIKIITTPYRGPDPRTNQLSSIREVVHMPDASVPAKLEFNDLSDAERDFELLILGTDYDSFAVVSMCMGFTHTDSVIFILTREEKPAEEVIMKAVPVLDKNKIGKSSFSRPKCDRHYENSPFIVT